MPIQRTRRRLRYSVWKTVGPSNIHEIPVRLRCEHVGLTVVLIGTSVRTRGRAGFQWWQPLGWNRYNSEQLWLRQSVLVHVMEVSASAGWETGCLDERGCVIIFETKRGDAIQMTLGSGVPPISLSIRQDLVGEIRTPWLHSKSAVRTGRIFESPS